MSKDSNKKQNIGLIIIFLSGIVCAISLSKDLTFAALIAILIASSSMYFMANKH